MAPFYRALWLQMPSRISSVMFGGALLFEHVFVPACSLWCGSLGKVPSSRQLHV